MADDEQQASKAGSQTDLAKHLLGDVGHFQGRVTALVAAGRRGPRGSFKPQSGQRRSLDNPPEPSSETGREAGKQRVGDKGN